jgi:hypothetical protein
MLLLLLLQLHAYTVSRLSTACNSCSWQRQIAGKMHKFFATSYHKKHAAHAAKAGDSRDQSTSSNVSATTLPTVPSHMLIMTRVGCQQQLLVFTASRNTVSQQR